jgi:hypothetical protein
VHDRAFARGKVQFWEVGFALSGLQFALQIADCDLEALVWLESRFRGRLMQGWRGYGRVWVSAQQEYFKQDALTVVQHAKYEWCCRDCVSGIIVIQTKEKENSNYQLRFCLTSWVSSLTQTRL